MLVLVIFICHYCIMPKWLQYKRDKGVVYPNVKSTLDLLDETLSSVPLPSGDPACSDTTPGSTNCSLTVQFPKDIYNVSVSLTNTFGSTMNSSMFDSELASTLVTNNFNITNILQHVLLLWKMKC